MSDEKNKDINIEDNEDFINFLDNYLDQINQQIKSTNNNLRKISHCIKKINQEKRKIEYQSVPGVSGWFDGFYMQGDDGKKYDVNPNYAAKSRLLYGDKLKLIEEEGGKKVYKQIEKREAIEIAGILHKKEGKWYLLSDSGSYRLSDVAAEYQGAELNLEAVAEIPEEDKSVPFAALKEVKKPRPEKADKKTSSSDNKKPKPKKENKSSTKETVKETGEKKEKKEEKVIDLKETDNKPKMLEDDDLR